MLRVFGLATAVVLLAHGAASQPLQVLHITVTVIDAERKPVPVPNHALLISDEPPTAAPRRVVTRADGTVDVRLRPGSYTIESDQPVSFRGTTYQWLQLVEMTSGRDGTLTLTADNAETAAGAAAAATDVRALESDPALLLPPWQDSIVTLWTPIAPVAGFVVDGSGLIATSQRAIGTATSVEVQLTPSVKVAGAVVAADRSGDAAIVRFDPAALASARPLPLPCAQPPAPLVEGFRILSLGARAGQPGRVTSGAIARVESGQVIADIELDDGGIGGPLFDLKGAVVAIASKAETADQAPARRDRHVVAGIAGACGLLDRARQILQSAPPPSGTRLPVEPEGIPADALKAASAARTAPLGAYQTSSPDFDVTFITPPLLYGSQGASASNRQRRPLNAARLSEPLEDFANWSDYVAGYPAVLLIRVTPKLTESFWTTLARGAARTQGIGIPPIKKAKASFARMRAFCGDAEVTPVHPFQIERRVSETEALYEGLYAFPHDALAPACGSVKLLLYSENDQDKPRTRTVDAKLLEQVWQDFAPYRTAR